MGTTVLAAPASPSPDLRLYAHCLPAGKGGVGLVAINTGSAPQQIATGGRARAWVLTGQPLDTREVRVNGAAPGLDDRGGLTGLGGVEAGASLAVPGQSIAFIAVAAAGNPACR